MRHLRTPLWRHIQVYTRNWFQAVSCNCIMLHGTDCLRPAPLTFAPPFWLVLLRFTTQRASRAQIIFLHEGSLVNAMCWPIFLFKSDYHVQFMMMEAEGLRNV